MKKIGKGKEVFSLLVVEKSDGAEVFTTYLMMQQMMRKFSDVFPED